MSEDARAEANLRQRRYLHRLRSPGDFTNRDWQELVKVYGDKCLSCGASGDWKSLHIDHITPIAQGGLNVIENIQPLCCDCNREKGNTDIDYRPEREQASFLVVENTHYSTGSFKIESM